MAEDTNKWIIPVTVGCCLAALLIIILIVYVVLKKRSRRSDYDPLVGETR